VSKIIESASPQYRARDAYNNGEGQSDNPYDSSDHSRIEWALEMGRCQHEELDQLMGGYA
jgi:hypothetical protein|tara:strand:+ start:1215 stop:1394 length:180 start_codon:yes stop_codon:yes gene_type:complete